ncbi:hypothetical protein JTB14_025363 [Gonioctena quinquepunctata]|nr:hypothetical protein JTB14_025363 [Gonioctena quinquepunctata]
MWTWHSCPKTPSHHDIFLVKPGKRKSLHFSRAAAAEAGAHSVSATFTGCGSHIHSRRSKVKFVKLYKKDRSMKKQLRCLPALHRHHLRSKELIVSSDAHFLFI